MSESYEFSAGCFLKLSISSGYFTIKIQGDLPARAASAILADDVEQVLSQLDKCFQLSNRQREGSVKYLMSKGMQP